MNLFNEELLECPDCHSRQFYETNTYGLNKEISPLGIVTYNTVQPIKEIHCRECNKLIMKLDVNTNPLMGFGDDKIKER